jgi:hypothetical protein
MQMTCFDEFLFLSAGKDFKRNFIDHSRSETSFIHIYATGDLLGNECCGRNGRFRQITKLAEMEGPGERVAVNANIDGLIDWIAEIPPNESDREVR